jgi:hypothetical protein
MPSPCGQPENVNISRGEDNIGTFNRTPLSYRKWRKTCGGHVFTEHPGLGLTDVYAAVIPGVPFIPGLHVNYSETKLSIWDGLLKLRTFPTDFVGQGLKWRNSLI